MLQKLCLLFFIPLIFISTSSAQEKNELVWSGYGDLHYHDVIYENNIPHTPGRLNLHRFNLLADYNFNNRFSFHSEVSLNKTLLNSSESGDFFLNQAYIDWNLHPEFGIRGGLLLVPSGLTNLNREPTSFHGVVPPNVEKYIIPTTWSEIGIGIYGQTETDLNYKVYAMAGLKPGSITGASGIRDARQNGFQSSTANIALASSLDYQMSSGFKLGASYYISTIRNRIEDNVGERIPSLEGSFFNLIEAHILYQKERFEAKGLFALSRILDVEDLNREFNNAAGQIQSGGYIELAYDILPFLKSDRKEQLFVFARGESYDTNFTTGNIPRNNEYLREELTVGFSYKPISKLIVKTEFQFLTSLGTKYVERLNIGVGYSF